MILSDLCHFEIKPEMRDVLTKMRKIYAIMRDFTHDCGTVDTYEIWIISDKCVNKVPLSTCKLLINDTLIVVSKYTRNCCKQTIHACYSRCDINIHAFGIVNQAEAKCVNMVCTWSVRRRVYKVHIVMCTGTLTKWHVDCSLQVYA